MELFQHLILGALLGSIGAGIKFTVYLMSASDQLHAEQLRADPSLLQRLFLKYLWPDLPVALLSGSGAVLMNSCTVSLSDRHIASLTRIARDHGVTRGEVVRRAIDAYAVETELPKQ